MSPSGISTQRLQQFEPTLVRFALGLGLCSILLLFQAGLVACDSSVDSPDLGLIDLDAQRVDPFATLGDRATVFIFVRDDCPVSNRYAPEIQRLQAKFEGQGFNFCLVYPDRELSAEGMRSHMDEYGYSCAALKDPSHALVRWASVSITPEVAVVLADKTLIYRGRIDDQWVEFGRARPEPEHRDLEELLAMLAADELPEFRSTPAVGCYLADLE